MALDAFESRRASLKEDGKTGRWFSPLERYGLTKLGCTPVAEIGQRLIRDAMAPIWHTKSATAKKAIERLQIVVGHAAALGLDVDLQAVAKAKALLGQQRHEPASIPSMPWQDVPSFYQFLNEPTPAHLALRLLILTGLRSKPIRFARNDESVGDVWTIPAANMKGRKGATNDFRVPLPPEALKVIEAAGELQRNGYLFVARKTVISDGTMSRHMERRGLVYCPHGVRASLRTRLAEEVEAPHEVAETMIAHVSGSKVVRSYRRTDFLEQRRALSEQWATHCSETV